LNLYGYVVQDPVNLVDPEGKNPADAAGAGWLDAATFGYGTTVMDYFGLVRLYDLDDPTDRAAYEAAGLGVGAARRYAAKTTVFTARTLAAQAKKVCTGRGKNKLRPDPAATGDHSTFRRNGDGRVKHYEQWGNNPRNPSGFDSVKRYDGEGAAHTNKVTGVDVSTPHVQSRDVPGGVRPAYPYEIPG
jgi:hypothetical protein